MSACRPPTPPVDRGAERAALPKIFHYVIVRSDLPTGIAGAFILHAAGETGPAYDNTNAILLAAKDEQELRALALLDREARLIFETEGPYKGHAMAIGFPPKSGKRNAFGHLRLWKGAMRD